MISRPILVVGSVLMQSYQLGSVGWGVAQILWSEQPSVPPAEDVITGLEFLIDLPMCQQDETKKMLQWTRLEKILKSEESVK